MKGGKRRQHYLLWSFVHTQPQRLPGLSDSCYLTGVDATLFRHDEVVAFLAEIRHRLTDGTDLENPAFDLSLNVQSHLPKLV